MTESPRRDPYEPTQPVVDYPEPAYAYNPTQQLPAYHYEEGTGGGYQPPGGAPAPEPEKKGSRLWLWILAGLAVLLILGLIAALLVTNGSSEQTVVAPQPVTPLPGTSKTTHAPTTTSRAPIPHPLPPATSPGETGTPGATEPVTYEVSGEGRAINITYIDSGNMLQTEFNVILPWSKQVELPEPATQTASVTVVNFGSEVTCTVTVNGTQTQHRSGTGLTVCVGQGEGRPPR